MNTEKITKLLNEGKIVITPTDTIYGIMGDSTNEEVIKKIYKIKNRPLNKPLILLMDSYKMIKKYTKNISDKEDILDFMGSEELGANLFRITQTEAKLRKDKIGNEIDACNTHFIVGKTVRKAIQELGGTMPEDLPTPKKSIKELEKEELMKITNK